MIGVREEFRGFGLGAILVQKVIDRAKELNFKLISYEASNIFSLNLALSLRFQIQCSILYDEYEEEEKGEGNRIGFPFKGINLMYREFLKGKDKIIDNPAEEYIFLTLKLE